MCADGLRTGQPTQGIAIAGNKTIIVTGSTSKWVNKNNSDKAHRHPDTVLKLTACVCSPLGGFEPVLDDGTHEARRPYSRSAETGALQTARRLFDSEPGHSRRCLARLPNLLEETAVLKSAAAAGVRCSVKSGGGLLQVQRESFMGIAKYVRCEVVVLLQKALKCLPYVRPLAFLRLGKTPAKAVVAVRQ